MKTRDKIVSVIEKYNMVKTGDTVVAAVSGGADSMCLLHFFNEYSSEKEFNLIVAHVNHGIRGSEADRDENFVRSYCEKNNIKFVSAHYDVPAISRETGESEELCGRRLRYEFFSSLGNNIKISTAHNLNDCMETFLFNLARGTGIKGLCGIPAVRDNIIRPLIECTRQEIEDYLYECGVDYVTDSTNLCDDYSRNKIRHNVIPVLSDINSGFPSVFLSCIKNLSDTENYMASQTDKIFKSYFCEKGFPVKILLQSDGVIRDRIIKKITSVYGSKEAEFRHIGIISEFLSTGGAIVLPGNVSIVSDGEYLFKEEKAFDIQDINEPFDINKEIYCFKDCIVSIKTVDKTGINLYNNMKPSNFWYMDGDKIKSAVFRHRHDGDRFKFPNGNHSKSIKNLFSERNISSAERQRLLFLADDKNIFWIEGIGTSEYAKVTDESINILQINVTCD